MNLKLKCCQKDLKIGQLVLSDRTVCDDVTDEDKVIGLIAWLNPENTHGYLVTIGEKKRPWESAARYCYEYEVEGLKQGMGIFPTQEQWQNVFQNVIVLNHKFEAAGLKILSGGYWSSTEDGANYAWFVPAMRGETNTRNKRTSHLIRCLVEFDLE